MDTCTTVITSNSSPTANASRCEPDATATRAREAALGFSRDDLAPCFRNNDLLNAEQFAHVMQGKTTGALRASLGIASNFADAHAYVMFVRSFIDRPVPAVAYA